MYTMQWNTYMLQSICVHYAIPKAVISPKNSTKWDNNNDYALFTCITNQQPISITKKSINKTNDQPITKSLVIKPQLAPKNTKGHPHHKIPLKI